MAVFFVPNFVPCSLAKYLKILVIKSLILVPVFHDNHQSFVPCVIVFIPTLLCTLEIAEAFPAKEVVGHFANDFLVIDLIAFMNEKCILWSYCIQNHWHHPSPWDKYVHVSIIDYNNLFESFCF